MGDWTTEQTEKYISVYNEIRELHPDTDPQSPVFTEAVETECDFYKALDRLVRKFREAKTFHAAVDKLVEELSTRREAADKEAVEWEAKLHCALCHIEDATDESVKFVRPGYVLSLKDGFEVDLAVLPEAPPLKFIGDMPDAKKLEALFLERIEVKAGIDYLKAEAAAVKAQSDQAATRLASINEKMAELVQPMLKPTESSVRLPIGTITLKKAKRRVRIKDRDVIADKYRIYPPLPDWVPNEPLLERDLLLGKVLGAELDNGGPPTVSCRVK